MSGKLLFILNPRAGKGKIKNKLMEIIDIFVKDGWTVTVHTTQTVKDAYETVNKNGSKYDRIVVSGGDGTLNEVIRGLMTLGESKRPAIGYIPAGTVNDFASNLRISKNMKKAAENIVSGTEFKCDIGEFNNKNFVYIAAFGAFTNVSYETPQQNKNILGQSAYLLEGIKQLSSLKSYKLKVKYDGNEIEDEFILGMVANSNRIAGMKSRALKAQLNDGLFEVMLIKQPKTVFESNDIISKLAIGDLSGNSFYVFRTEKIEFISEESIPWTLDGEFGGSVSGAEISVKKEAVTLIF
ncbi:MAG: YegS/Rv2252/BmrU family lipid kinase [Ruminococcaceae bacterium]|nr:YegS/Rv2252/BmrU family lipid kinase [Oscillospiraceae bacterium]